MSEGAREQPGGPQRGSSRARLSEEFRATQQSYGSKMPARTKACLQSLPLHRTAIASCLA